MRLDKLLERETDPRAYKILYTLRWVRENGYCHICRGPCGTGMRFYGHHNWKVHRKTQHKIVDIGGVE